QGMKLFRKAWAAFPNERTNLLGQLYQEEVWRMPEIYQYVREALIPSDQDYKVEAWGGIDQIMSWNGDGRINTAVGRLMEASLRQNKTESLRKDVEDGLKKLPDWSAGKVILSLLLLRRGKTEEARKLVVELMEDKKNPMPLQARWVLAQEMEGYGGML